MIRFELNKKSALNRDKLYAISIDVENFPNLMPRHFKSVIIRKTNCNEILVDETISFLNRSLHVKTRHVIIHPSIHEVHILSGPLHGSSFIESYDEIPDGRTNVTIAVSVKLNGILHILQPFDFLIKRQMKKIMDEFLESAESHIKTNVQN